MTNKEVASQINLLAALMELHGENSFKTRIYQNAFNSLRKWDRPLIDMSSAEISTIPNVAPAAASKIRELIEKGAIENLEILKSKTPIGIQQLLSIKGMGPKKIRMIWDSLGIETPAELLYACQENRLVALPGFGLKTQEDLCVKISYFLDSMHRYLYGVIEQDMLAFEENWKIIFPDTTFTWAGEFARKEPVISSIECVLAPSFDPAQLEKLKEVELIEQSGDNLFSIKYDDRYIIRCMVAAPDQFMLHWGMQTFSPEFHKKMEAALGNYDGSNIEEFLRENGYEGLPPELFDYEGIENASPSLWRDLLKDSDIRGVVHNHSTYSDGIHTLEEMAVRVRDSGYSYFGICDHSQSAFYANGLTPDRLIDQWKEIDRLNKELAPFVILKGIESDILNDGSLDYSDDILSQFELVVASIHSNLRMDEEKATMRLIRAIENPYTNILGHPTSRLLLARPGYPVNHKKIIDACAQNRVVMELNANPQRMDIDYKWLDYCREKGVWISVNPDAHSRTQLGYMKYGVITARKGGVRKQDCLNALELGEFKRVISKR